MPQAAPQARQLTQTMAGAHSSARASAAPHVGHCGFCDASWSWPAMGCAGRYLTGMGKRYSAPVASLVTIGAASEPVYKIAT